jgi:hypothetical protein
MTGGDNGWERWQALNAQELRRTLGLDGSGDSVDDGEGDYEEPEEGTKKRKPKGPRGGVKKQKKAPAKPPAAKRKAVGTAGKPRGGSGRAKTAKK